MRSGGASPISTPRSAHEALLPRARSGVARPSLCARTPLNFGGDSLAGGSVHLADATAHCALAGVSWSGHIHFDKWGPLGDGLASVGVLLGVSRIEDVRLTPAATAIGVTRIAGRASFTWGIDTRLDQRFYRGVVGSIGVRVLSTARALRVETDSGSNFQSADAALRTYVARFGLGYWF